MRNIPTREYIYLLFYFINTNSIGNRINARIILSGYKPMDCDDCVINSQINYRGFNYIEIMLVIHTVHVNSHPQKHNICRYYI